MPPKRNQVYGKRNNTSRAKYSQFLTPDKDDLDNAILKKQTRKNEDVGEVELQLKALDLDDDRERGLEGAREERDKPQARATRKVAASVEIERRLESLSLQENVVAIDEDGSRQTRKALETRDTNTGLKVKPPRKRDKSKRLATQDIITDKADREANIENHEEAQKPEQTWVPNRNESATEDVVAPSTPTRPISAKPKTQRKSTSPAPMIQQDDLYDYYASSLLALSDQRRIIPFQEWSSDLEACVDVEKIAEASFSEVYRLTVRDAIPACAKESVLKIVALRTPPDAPLPSECTGPDRFRRKADATRQLKKEREKRDEDNQWKSCVEDVLGEVRLLQNLNHIPGFTNFRALTILQGRPTATFGQAWKNWNKTRPKGKKSQFPDPGRKASYEDTQLWAVIEMQDAGTDCGKVIEGGGIKTIWEVWDIFWGVCLSVAKAEEACRFEHRDLHMDNICIRSSILGANLSEPLIRNPLKRKLGFTGLETTVIDYTLSRADIINASRRMSSSSTASTDSSTSIPIIGADKDAEVAYLDLNKDPCLFEGDAEVEYQYEIYRYMRGVVYHNDPLHHTNTLPDTDHPPSTPRRSPRKHSDQLTSTPPRRSPRKTHNPLSTPPQEIWKSFHPKTNLVWAHFILHSLLENLSGHEPSSLTPASLMHNMAVNPAHDMDAEKIYKKAVKLHKILLKVAMLLEPEALGRKSRLTTMRDLVILGLEAGWLGTEDVTGG